MLGYDLSGWFEPIEKRYDMKSIDTRRNACLATRLREHAQCHEHVAHQDDEQRARADDLRAAANALSAIESVRAEIACLAAALAAGPTDGPWEPTRRQTHGTKVVTDYGLTISWCGTNGHYAADISHNISATEAHANARFIAACSPDRIRRLIDAIGGLE